MLGLELTMKGVGCRAHRYRLPCNQSFGGDFAQHFLAAAAS